MKNNVSKKREWGQTIGKSNPLSGYKKLSTSTEVIKILVTNIILDNKNYLILTNFQNSISKQILLDGGEYCGVYSFFNVIFGSELDMSTSQTNVSPLSIFNTSRMVLGREVDKVPPVACTLVLYLNFIPPIYTINIIYIIILVLLIYII